jgi:YD repeat-containing protein
MRRTIISIALASALLPAAAQAHITVWPRQSDLGAREKYVVRAPNEKRVATVRVEGAFPREARVTQLEQVAGWTVEVRRDASGAIVGATWSGDLPPDQFVEFGLLAANPKTGTVLTWTFTQVYADGSRVEWAGPPGSATPAPQVQLRRPIEGA